ncbi:MAG TPA: HEAT repeat domain-containing protein [Terriglobales bacterium]|nr:HEAT repeat domain-containing protein [Terriglobales bacterium]
MLLALSVLASACPTSLDPAFTRMIADSTLIVRGTVLSETNGPWDKGIKQHWSEVLVERTYKGDVPTQIRVGWKEYEMCPRAALAKDSYGLLFLRREASGFVFTDEVWGRVPVSRIQDDSHPADVSVALERDFKRAIQLDSGDQLIEDVNLLGDLGRPVATTELHALLPTADEALEATVHLALLKLHDYSELPAAGTLIETVPEVDMFYLPRDRVFAVRQRMAFEIEMITDHGQLPLLLRFTLSPNRWLRQSAAYAVRQMHDPSGIPYLVRLLDDPSAETRIQAIRGIQEIVRPGIEAEGWVPGNREDGTRVTEQAVLARWRSWWQSEGKAKYGTMTFPQ